VNARISPEAESSRWSAGSVASVGPGQRGETIGPHGHLETEVIDEERRRRGHVVDVQ